jgi:ribosome-associated protein
MGSERADAIRVNPSIVIDRTEIEEHFIRASGPGGQNVNKVATAVQLRYDFAHSPALPEDVRRRLAVIAGSRATRDGVLVIEAQRFRSQSQNRRDAVERLIELVREAAVKPKPRRKTKPSAGARARRLESKQRRGAVKRQRTGPIGGED